MATPQKKLERILECLICPICQEQCKLPKILPCNHMGCKVCLENWVAVRTKLICPQCNTEQALPSTGVSGLPDNLIARQISQDLQDFAVDDDTLVECDQHDELVTRVCQTCLVGVCQVCATESHTGHLCFDAGSSWRFIKEKMDKVQADLKNKKDESRMVLTSLRQMKSFLDGKYHGAQRNITAYKESLLQRVQELEEELNEQLEALYKEKVAELHAEMEKASEFERNLQEGLASYSTIENATSSGKPCALNTTTYQSFSKLQQLSSSSVMPKIPKGYLNLEFKSGNQYKFNPGDECKITCLPIPLDKVTVEYINFQSDPVQVKTHRKLQFRLTILSSKGREDADLPAVTANIHSPTGQTKDIAAYRQSDGTYMTTFFTPAHVGRYKMEIRVFNIPLNNSKQEMLVHPVGRLVNDFSGMDFPWQSPSDIVQWNKSLLVGDLGKNQIICLDPSATDGRGVSVMFSEIHCRSMSVYNNFLFICDPEANAIMKYSLLDKSLNLIYRHSTLESPRGIAVDSRGYLFVSDWVNHSLIVFDERAKMVGSYGDWGVSDGQLINPNYLAINSKDQVIIADHGNHRLQVFDPSTFSFVKTIPVRLNDDSMYCCGIDVDSNDNIYISACSVDCSDKLAVMVYAKDGTFISSFSDGLNDDVDGVCVTGDNYKLYIAARDSGSVSCFEMVVT